MVPRKPAIKVEELKQENFLAFNQLLSTTYVHKKQNSDGESIKLLNIKWLQYRVDSPGKFLYKFSFQDKQEFKEVNLNRRSKLSTFAAKNLTPISSQIIQLPDKKVKDLKSVLEFINPISRPFYESLISCN